jgi:hypothetical protein
MLACLLFSSPFLILSVAFLAVETPRVVAAIREGRHGR